MYQDYFAVEVGIVSKEQDWRFCQDMKDMQNPERPERLEKL